MDLRKPQTNLDKSSRWTTLGHQAPGWFVPPALAGTRRWVPRAVLPVAFPAEPRAPSRIRSRGDAAAAPELTPRGGPREGRGGAAGAGRGGAARRGGRSTGIPCGTARTPAPSLQPACRRLPRPRPLRPPVLTTSQ